MESSISPRTLLSHANVGASELRLTDASLVLVDYQNEYVDGSLALPDGEKAMTVAADLLSRFRAAGAPVFHVVHHGRPGGALFDPESTRVAIPEKLAPTAAENIVVKHMPSAFTGTDLEQQLRATGRKQVVVIGFMTHMCTESTARAAAELGFEVIVISDACATRDLPHPTEAGSSISARDLHTSALAAISDRFATVLPSSALA